MTTTASPPSPSSARSPVSQPRRRGACPGILAPMAVADGLLVRIRLPTATLDAAPAAAVADLARRHGNGRIDLSQRGNLQIRGVRPDSLAPLTDGLRALGLVGDAVAAEAVRNVLCSPTCGLDPACLPVRPLAAALDAALAASPALWALPAKFSFLINGGGRAPLDGGVADIRFDALPGGTLFRVAVGGDRLTATPLGCCLPDAVVATALALAGAFLALAADRHRRMAALVAAGGAAALRRRVPLPPLPSSPPTEGPPAEGPPDEAPPLSAILGNQTGWLGVAFPFGGLDALTLARMAALDRPLRFTPWRAVLLAGRPDPDHAAALARLGGILAADDPRLSLSACSGRGACDCGLSDARGDALALAARFPALLRTRHLHVSACAKGCAHPGPAALTLTAHSNGGGDALYDLAVDGAAGDPTPWRGLTLAQAARLLAALDGQTSHHPPRSFAEILRRAHPDL